MALKLYDKYRDEYGYIDLNKAEKDGLFDPSILRSEYRGSDRGVGLSEENYNNALKGWFDFQTSSKEHTETFLVRTNMFRGEETNYGDYAELIFEEYAKSLGIRTPHYDLFKYNGEKGVLSQKLIDKDETMISLSDNLSNPHQQGVTLDFLDNLLTKQLLLQGKSQKDIEKIKLELRKITILDISTLNEDRHLGNICLIYNQETGEISLGIYDNEITFLLAHPINEFSSREDVEMYSELSLPIISTQLEASPIDAVEEIISKSDSELLDFLGSINNINMYQLYDNIEKRIHAPIPNRAKNIATIAWQSRRKELSKIHKKIFEKQQKESEAKLLALIFGGNNDNIGGEGR